VYPGILISVPLHIPSSVCLLLYIPVTIYSALLHLEN
jgi:hypothetical protein